LIPVSKPKITKQDIKKVLASLKDGWVSSDGPDVIKFEEKFANFIGKKYCIAVSSGTAALEIAVKSLNLNKNDEVIIPNFTIISNVLAVIRQRAKPVFLDCSIHDWNIDYAYSGTQKCLAAPPGLSPASISNSAIDYIKNRKKLPSSWYLDLLGISNYWGKDHIAHQTTPINLVYALNEALNLTFDEGLENKYLRHKTMSEGLKKGLKELCLSLPVDPKIALNQLTVVNVPEKIDDQKFRDSLLKNYFIEIGRGLGEFSGKVWRIGLMGESCVPQNVFALLNAFEKLLIENNFDLKEGMSLSEASKVINGQNVRPY